MTRDWFQYARITVASVLFNSLLDDEYYFYIMSNGFDEKEKDAFLSLKKIRSVEFEFILMDDSYFDGAIHDWLGVSSSYRLHLPSLVNESKILYIDSDMLALDDIEKLYSIDISDYYLAMVEDKYSEVMAPRINLAADENYFNGGMQLINLDKFRNENLEEKIMKKLREEDKYTDQDVINDICRGKILSLPLKYNIMNTNYGYAKRREEFEKDILNPILLHFTLKPWQDSQTMLAEKWFEYEERVKKLFS